ncbi:hypothetical protein J23TS9_21940 [Paenibacillus sp. J23TS9]|nr:hypothetical protein J23TS9_21940 [Paenibacillus sp. J23TS9]
MYPWIRYLFQLKNGFLYTLFNTWIQSASRSNGHANLIQGEWSGIVHDVTLSGRNRDYPEGGK